MLRSYVNARQDDGDQYLAPLEFAYNNTHNASAGQRPFFLNPGFHPGSQLQLILAAISETPAAMQFGDSIHGALIQAEQAIADAQTRAGRNANRSRRDISFRIGDQGLLSTSNLRTVSGLQPGWFGAFPVKSIINPVAVQLDLPQAFRMHA